MCLAFGTRRQAVAGFAALPIGGEMPSAPGRICLWPLHGFCLYSLGPGAVGSQSGVLALTIAREAAQNPTRRRVLHFCKGGLVEDRDVEKAA